MQVSVTCRHAAVGPAALEYARSRVERLERAFDGISKVEVIFDQGDERPFSVKLIVSAPRAHVLVCDAERDTATAAFDEALARIQRPLKRLKDRLRANNPRAARRTTRRLMRRQARAQQGPL